MKKIARWLVSACLLVAWAGTVLGQTAPAPAPPPSGEMPIMEYGFGAVAALIILGVVCFPEARE